MRQDSEVQHGAAFRPLQQASTRTPQPLEPWTPLHMAVVAGAGSRSCAHHAAKSRCESSKTPHHADCQCFTAKSFLPTAAGAPGALPAQLPGGPPQILQAVTLTRRRVSRKEDRRVSLFWRLGFPVFSCTETGVRSKLFTGVRSGPWSSGCMRFTGGPGAGAEGARGNADPARAGGVGTPLSLQCRLDSRTPERSACMSFSLLRTFSPRRLASRAPERSACTSLSLRRVIHDASRPLARHVSAPTAHARRPLGRRIRGETCLVMRLVAKPSMDLFLYL